MLGRVLAALFAFPALFSSGEWGWPGLGGQIWGCETSPRSSGPRPLNTGDWFYHWTKDARLPLKAPQKFHWALGLSPAAGPSLS